MQPLDLVRPPRDRHLAPFRQYSGMMAFFLGEITHHVRESERGNKVFKGEDAPQAFNTVKLDNAPVRYLRLQVGNLCVC